MQTRSSQAVCDFCQNNQRQFSLPKQFFPPQGSGCAEGGVNSPRLGCPCPTPAATLPSPGGGLTAPPELELDLQHPSASFPGKKTSQVFSQRKDKPWMFRCHHTVDNAPDSSVTGQVTHWQRKLRHTQTAASGVSHAGAQPYELLLDS